MDLNTHFFQLWGKNNNNPEDFSGRENRNKQKQCEVETQVETEKSAPPWEPNPELADCSDSKVATAASLGSQVAAGAIVGKGWRVGDGSTSFCDSYLTRAEVRASE